MTSHGSILSVETGLQPGWSGLSVLEGVRDFLSKISILALGPNQPPTHWVLGSFPENWGGGKVVGCKGTPTSILGMTGATRWFKYDRD